jgi:hypothetical protein
MEKPQTATFSSRCDGRGSFRASAAGKEPGRDSAMTAADDLKPFGSQQRRQQIDEQQQRYEAGQREHGILDLRARSL